MGGSSSCLGVKFEQNSMMIPCLLADRPAAQGKSETFSRKCSESLLPKGYPPNLLEITLWDQIFAVQVRCMKFWLQLVFFKPVKMAGSDLT